MSKYNIDYFNADYFDANIYKKFLNDIRKNVIYDAKIVCCDGVIMASSFLLSISADINNFKFDKFETSTIAKVINYLQFMDEFTPAGEDEAYLIYLLLSLCKDNLLIKEAKNKTINYIIDHIYKNNIDVNDLYRKYDGLCDAIINAIIAKIYIGFYCKKGIVCVKCFRFEYRCMVCVADIIESQDNKICCLGGHHLESRYLHNDCDGRIVNFEKTLTMDENADNFATIMKRIWSLRDNLD